MAEGQGARSLEVLRAVHYDDGGGYCLNCNERYPCLTSREVDALAAENARLVAALEEVYAYHQQDAPLYPSDSSWETVRDALEQPA